MESFLDDLLDLSKLESGKVVYEMKSVNIWQVAENAVSEMESICRQKNLHARVKDPLILTKIVCDKDKIDQVIRNLLSNALKFTPENKQITIAFNPGELPKGRWIVDIEMISALSVSVKDESVGIPESELESFFDKFI